MHLFHLSCPDALAPGSKPGEVTRLPCSPLEETVSAASLVTIDFNPPTVGFTDADRTLSVSGEDCFVPLCVT